MRSLKFFSLCVLGFLISCSFPEAKADSCAREWLQNQGNCYGYFKGPASWYQAEIECQSYGRGAHLVSVLTRAESLLVAEYISTYEQEPISVWIGLHDVRQTRKWKWTDESPYNYKAWESGQPDNHGNSEHCTELRRSAGYKEWNDNQCGNFNAYICKHEL